MADAASPRLAALEQALGRLEEALAKPEDDIVRDACIQRFEFTFEMAWRAVQAHALAEGVECVSPHDCFRTAFRLGLTDRDAPWIAMVEDRNRTAASRGLRTDRDYRVVRASGAGRLDERAGVHEQRAIRLRPHR